MGGKTNNIICSFSDIQRKLAELQKTSATAYDLSADNTTYSTAEEALATVPNRVSKAEFVREQNAKYYVRNFDVPEWTDYPENWDELNQIPSAIAKDGNVVKSSFLDLDDIKISTAFTDQEAQQMVHDEVEALENTGDSVTFYCTYTSNGERKFTKWEVTKYSDRLTETVQLQLNESGKIKKWEEVSSDKGIEIEYSTLKALKAIGALVPGQFYKITDYKTLTSQENTSSLEHRFDIIVQALSETKLSENAQAAVNKEDKFFKDQNLSAWKLKYSLSNDSDRFAWASSNGKGVIYEMEDEFGNKFPYDFKNILFNNTPVFSGKARNVVVEPHFTQVGEGEETILVQTLNNNIFVGDAVNVTLGYDNYNTNISDANTVVIGSNCYDIKLLNAQNIYIGDNCSELTINKNSTNKYVEIPPFTTELNGTALAEVVNGDNLNNNEDFDTTGGLTITYQDNTTENFAGSEFTIPIESKMKGIRVHSNVTNFSISHNSSDTSYIEFITVDNGNLIYDSRNDCNAIIKTETNKLELGCKNTIIPNDVTSLGNHAFHYCYGLTSIVIPNSVTHIGWSTFWGCWNLTSITIPNSVTYIGDYAFANCNQLNKVIVQDIAAWCGISFSNIDANPLYYAHRLYSDENTEVTDLVIPEGVTNISNYAFGGYNRLTSITIPDSMISVGNAAFQNCSGLTSITIPNSVTSIGEEAFAYCRGLASISIPNSVTLIGIGAFKGCNNLTSIVVENENTVYDSRNNCNAIIETATNTLIAGCKNTIIPQSVTSVGDYAFSDCDLTSIIIPNSVTSIGRGAFSWCTSLTSITIPNSVIDIGSDAFGGCMGLTSITIPGSVTSINDYTFSQCSGLTSVTIGSSVTSIGRYAFYECTRLTSVTIGNSVTSIDYWAFSGCRELTSVIIGNSVTSIGRWAFRNCSNLEKVYMRSTTPPSISSDIFDNDSNLQAIYIVPCYEGDDPRDYIYDYEIANGWKDYKDKLTLWLPTSPVPFNDEDSDSDSDSDSDDDITTMDPPTMEPTEGPTEEIPTISLPINVPIYYWVDIDYTEQTIENSEITSSILPETIGFSGVSEAPVVFVPNGAVLGDEANIQASFEGRVGQWLLNPPQTVADFNGGRVYYGSLLWFTCYYLGPTVDPNNPEESTTPPPTEEESTTPPPSPTEGSEDNQSDPGDVVDDTTVPVGDTEAPEVPTTPEGSGEHSKGEGDESNGSFEDQLDDELNNNESEQ